MQCVDTSIIIAGGKVHFALNQAPFEAESRKELFSLDVLSPLGNPVVGIEVSKSQDSISGVCRGQCPKLWTDIVSVSSPLEFRSLLCGLPGKVPQDFFDSSHWTQGAEGSINWQGQTNIAGRSAQTKFRLKRIRCETQAEPTDTTSANLLGLSLAAEWNFGWFSQTRLSANWKGCLENQSIGINSLELVAPEGSTRFEFDLFEPGF